jgi:hypothetical protein
MQSLEEEEIINGVFCKQDARKRGLQRDSEIIVMVVGVATTRIAQDVETGD